MAVQPVLLEFVGVRAAATQVENLPPGKSLALIDLSGQR